MKKVRYLMGAAGLAPAALGLMTQAPAAAAAQHTVKSRPAAGRAKMVSFPHAARHEINRAGCDGSRLRHTNNGDLNLSFYSKTVNGKTTCIGTIYVSAANGKYVGGFVSAASGNACISAKEADFISWGCHKEFQRHISVIGSSISKGGRFHSTRFSLPVF